MICLTLKKALKIPKQANTITVHAELSQTNTCTERTLCHKHSLNVVTLEAELAPKQLY